MSRASRTAALADHIDDATARLYSRQLELIRLSASRNKADTTVAVESAEIEACAASLVKSVEDLLVLVRTLKEAWILGQMRETKNVISTEELERRSAAAGELLAAIRRRD